MLDQQMVITTVLSIYPIDFEGVQRLLNSTHFTTRGWAVVSNVTVKTRILTHLELPRNATLLDGIKKPRYSGPAEGTVT
jgi:hypothetical protein